MFLYYNTADFLDSTHKRVVASLKLYSALIFFKISRIEVISCLNVPFQKKNAYMFELLLLSSCLEFSTNFLVCILLVACKWVLSSSQNEFTHPSFARATAKHDTRGLRRLRQKHSDEVARGGKEASARLSVSGISGTLAELNRK